MYAYAGSKAVGVNAHSENMVAAVELAVYLGSAEAQKLRYELRSVIPSSAAAVSSVMSLPTMRHSSGRRSSWSRMSW